MKILRGLFLAVLLPTVASAQVLTNGTSLPLSGGTVVGNIVATNLTATSTVQGQVTDDLANDITLGADVTLATAGDITFSRYQATITPAPGVNCAAAFAAAALTADCTIATLPAGMQLLGVWADVTAGFTCSGTCSGTKVVQCGTAAGGTQILAASLDVTATGQFGLADANLGSGMTRAAAIQGGLIGSWSTTTPISCRFTSGTGNWGNAATTFVNAGSIKFTLITAQIK